MMGKESNTHDGAVEGAQLDSPAAKCHPRCKGCPRFDSFPQKMLTHTVIKYIYKTLRPSPWALSDDECVYSR